MARIPGLHWRPIPENATQPTIDPVLWIVHTFVDSPTVDVEKMGDYFERADITLESHTVLGWTRHDQLLDTTVRADANYRANSFWQAGRLRGAVSTETEDDGTPELLPWNGFQSAELISTGYHLHRLHGIPAKLPSAWNGTGMGWHCMFPNDWTNVPGKTCPGNTRIEQFLDEILPGIRKAIAVPTPPPERPTDPDGMEMYHDAVHKKVFLDTGSKFVDITSYDDDFWALAGKGVPVYGVTSAFIDAIRY